MYEVDDPKLPHLSNLNEIQYLICRIKISNFIEQFRVVDTDDRGSKSPYYK